jgi:hypothetical protein
MTSDAALKADMNNSFSSGLPVCQFPIPKLLYENKNMLQRWGNMPAMDLVNLSESEKNTKMDLSIAFVGWFGEFILHQPELILHRLSGDLRHVVRIRQNRYCHVTKAKL